jgi:hypothetical protein
MWAVFEQDWALTPSGKKEAKKAHKEERKQQKSERREERVRMAAAS